MGMLSGKKTYVLAAVAVIYGVAMYLVGDFTLEQALDYIWSGGVAATLRAGVAKLGT